MNTLILRRLLHVSILFVLLLKLPAVRSHKVSFYLLWNHVFISNLLDFIYLFFLYTLQLEPSTITIINASAFAFQNHRRSLVRIICCSRKKTKTSPTLKMTSKNSLMSWRRKSHLSNFTDQRPDCTILTCSVQLYSKQMCHLTSELLPISHPRRLFLFLSLFSSISHRVFINDNEV